MTERTSGFRPEEQFSKEVPASTVVVRLPRVCEEDCWTYRHQKKEVLLGMHTDMLGSLQSTLINLKESTQKRLFIEGRVLTRKQEEELYVDPVFKFFWQARRYRADSYSQREVLTYILPVGSKITERQVRKYSVMNFAPGTLSQRVGYKVGWYNVADLCSSDAFYQYSQNALKPLLGGCNEFRIGMDVVYSPLLRMVQGRIIQGFRNNVQSVVKNATWLSDSILAASAKVFNI